MEGAMGLFDTLKRAAGKARKTADDLAEQHGDKIKDGIDKAAGLAEKKLGRGEAKQVDSIAAKAKGLVDDLAKPEAGEAPKPDAAPTDARAGERPEADAPAAEPKA
jgi:hypothetical protein